jgi:integrase
VKLTAETIRDAKPGTVLRDHVVEGLELHAKVTGKFWFLYYRNNARKQRRPKLGTLKALPLEAARELAREWHKRIARGEDPGAERSSYRASPTVADFCDTYLKHCVAYDKPRTLEEKRSKIAQHIKPLLGKIKVVDVKLSDINDALDKVAAGGFKETTSKGGLTWKRKTGGNTAARHVRAILSGIFSYAEHDDVKLRSRHSNPVRDAKTFAKAKRRRHMEGHEAPAVARALDALADKYPQRVAALWCILLAGTRVTELITARRSQLVKDTLILSEHKTDRTGDERVIVLPRQALSIIETLPDDNSGFIFGQGLTRYNIFTVWDKARELAGCPGLRVQDFRRTFASAAKSAGRSIETVGELFGHKDVETTKLYSHLFEEAAKAAAQDTADELEKRMRGNG